ncbi:MAG TPA: M43 family zinc metalloprotease [Saprospiraceae bacterium]|nr:M43 family zinc metalloprotease [Saprospiraceae bacterium]
MNLTLLITFCTIFIAQLSIAQSQVITITESHVQKQDVKSRQGNPDDHFNCGTDSHHEFLLATDATYRKNFLHHSLEIDSVLNGKPNDRSAIITQYTIPIVVHIIHLGEPVGTGSNISDAQILDAINGLNERFANSNGQGADCEIQFCLATQTPDGCSTSGINRVDGSGVPEYALEGMQYNSTCGADESAIKELSRWSPLDYYNVWVVHDICGEWAGYAQFPNGGDLDGMVIGREFMNGDSKTLAHELGHGLNIRHTFNGDGGGLNCPVNSNCSSDGDAICDTPTHRRNDCGSTNPCSNDGVWANSRNNWMSYCDIPLNSGRFTRDQRDRMHACLMVYPRDALLNSIGCTPIEMPVITSDDLPMCSGDSKELAATPTGGNFSLISGPGLLEGNELIATGEGTILIQYTSCIDTVYQSIETFQTPEPNLTIPKDTMCSGTTQIISTEPAGGDLIIMSGSGSLLGSELSAEAPGIIQIAYSIDVNGCSGNASRAIVVESTPEPVFNNSDDAMCEGELRVLSGLPFGGDFHIVSGPGSIHGDTLITEGIGTVVIGYDVVIQDCAAGTTQTIMVHELPAPLMTSSTELLCSGNERILSANPAGGSFSVLSGPGVITGDTLLATGTGEIQIQYTWNQNGCSAVATQSITAQKSPGVNFTASQDHFCMHDSITLSANPFGGIYEVLSGPGHLDSNILSAMTGGDILIRYSITQNGCTGSAQKLFSAIDVSHLAFTMDTSVMCSGSSRSLSAMPGGGIFWMIGGPGNISNSVLRSTGEGWIKIQYLINEEGCYGEITQRIPSRRTPTVEFATDSLGICIGEENFIEVIPDTSQLNLLYGPGMLNGHELTAIDTGILKVTGQIETNGCVGTDTLILSSSPIPVPEMNLDNPVICIGNSIPLSANPSGGTYNILSGAGIFHDSVLTALDIGSIQFAYTVEEHQCAGTAYGEIQVINPFAEIIIEDDLLISNSSIGVIQWLDCENNFEPLPGENNDTLLVRFSGTYALVNGEGDCIDTSECVLVELTSVKFGEPGHEIRVFPNPASSHVIIESDVGISFKEITLRNVVGEKVYSHRDVHSSAGLDLSGCGPGLYLLEVSFEDRVSYIFRIVKI